jgi:hypothetical protein
MSTNLINSHQQDHHYLPKLLAWQTDKTLTDLAMIYIWTKKNSIDPQDCKRSYSLHKTCCHSHTCMSQNTVIFSVFDFATYINHTTSRGPDPGQMKIACNESLAWLSAEIMCAKIQEDCKIQIQRNMQSNVHCRTTSPIHKILTTSQHSPYLQGEQTIDHQQQTQLYVQGRTISQYGASNCSSSTETPII